MPFIFQAIFLMLILGFVFWLVQKHIPIASPFREILYFLCVMALLVWLLEGFGIMHTHYIPRWR